MHGYRGRDLIIKNVRQCREVLWLEGEAERLQIWDRAAFSNVLTITCLNEVTCRVAAYSFFFFNFEHSGHNIFDFEVKSRQKFFCS